MPPQQGSDLPHGVRLWHLSPVAIKRYVALTTSIVVYVSIQTWGYVEPSNTAFTSNPSVAFGNLEQNFPREVALSSTGVAATQDLTGDSLSNLPWWASSSQREKTAVDAIGKFGTDKLAVTLLYARSTKARVYAPRTSAFVELVADHRSCPLETDALKTKTQQHHRPSTARREESCTAEYATCYDSCQGETWSRPVPGACHFVCVVIQKECEMCAAKNPTISRKIGRRIHSSLSAMLPPDYSKDDDTAKPVQDDTAGEMGNTSNSMSWLTVSRISGITYALWLVQAVAFVVWSWSFFGRLSEMEKKLIEMLEVQEEQAVLLAAINAIMDDKAAQAIDRVNQSAADTCIGLLVTGFNSVTSWPIELARQLGIIA